MAQSSFQMYSSNIFWWTLRICDFSRTVLPRGRVIKLKFWRTTYINDENESGVSANHFELFWCRINWIKISTFLAIFAKLASDTANRSVKDKARQKLTFIPISFCKVASQTFQTKSIILAMIFPHFVPSYHNKYQTLCVWFSLEFQHV